MSSPEKVDIDSVNQKSISEKYLSLFKGINDAIFVHPFSVEGFRTFIEVNDAACKLLGYTREELLNLSAKDISYKKDVQLQGSVEKRLNLMTEGQKIFEASFITKNGRHIPVEINSQVFDHMGQKVILSIARDLSERIKSNAKIKENEELLELIFNNVSEGLTFTDLHGTIQKINKGALNMHGYLDKEELLGKSIYTLIAPIDHNRAFANLQQTIDGIRSISLLYTFLKKDGTFFTGELLTSLITNSQKQSIGFLVVTKNVTEQVRTQQALLESETRYKLLSEATFEGIFICSRGKCNSYNHSARTMFGFSELDVIDQPFTKWIQPDMQKFVAKYLKQGFEKPFEAIAQRIDGTTFPCEIQLKNRTDRGSILQFIALRDISARKKAEETNSELEEQLRQSLKMEAIGRLTGGVAHDFNNILTVIISQSELLLKQSLSPKTMSDLKRIYTSGKRASRLTNQLLAFSRKQITHPKVIDFNAVIKDHIKMLKRLLGEHIEVKARFSKEDIFVTIDTGQLEQIIMNLCVNARDAMLSGGTLFLETSLKPIDAKINNPQFEINDGLYASLTVTDSGCGMDEKTLSHIFEPFFTTKGRGEGTGLGLSTVYGIVQQNHGFIQVKSTIDSGTTFKVCLPTTSKNAELQPPKNELNYLNSYKATILLVEDDDSVRDIAKETLLHIGYDVLTAENGRSGYDLFLEKIDSIDFLLTDIVMPIMDGKELATLALKLRPDLPVLYMTGYPEDIISNYGVHVNEINLLQKPFNLSELGDTISKMLIN